MDLKTTETMANMITALQRWYRINCPEFFELASFASSIPPEQYFDEFLKFTGMNGDLWRSNYVDGENIFIVSIDTKNKIQMLLGPHYRAIIKAWHLKRGTTHDTGSQHQT